MAIATESPTRSAIDQRYRQVSGWLDGVPEPLDPRAPLPGDAQVDVAIAGGGLTGLWTAYCLAKADPRLRIVICERDIVGYGASGRNGGFQSAGMAGEMRVFKQYGGMDNVRRAERAFMDGIDWVGGVVADEEIDCGWHKGGALRIATSPTQAARVQAGVAGRRERGFTDADVWEISLDELQQRVRFHGAVSATYTPHCARIDPARLTRGLARACERLGVTIHEQTPVTAIEQGRLVCQQGTVHADVVVRATEAFTRDLPGGKRRYMRVYSHMLQTEVLPDHVWAELGWDNCEPIADQRYHFFYAQRTMDNRIAIGGRGTSYYWGDRIDDANDHNEAIFARIDEALRFHFPAAKDAAIEHRWGGSFAAPRDWSMQVDFDRATGIAMAGGFAGHGLTGTSIAGRTLADMILDRESDLLTLPWVGHACRKWEPEPLRAIAAKTISGILLSADEAEQKSGEPAKRVRLVKRFMPGR
jgi:glycine/D-amino acid oxidase-like deaminating enzyme